MTDPLAKSPGYGLGGTKPPSLKGGKGKEPMETDENGLGHLSDLESLIRLRL